MKKIVTKITIKKLLVLLLIASVSALAFAYFSQFVFGYQPCILCLYQRKPFFAVIAIASLSLVFFNSRGAQKISLIICLILLLINSVIAFYHVGVEQKIFKGPSFCQSSSIYEAKTIDELERILLSTKAIRCDEPNFIWFGLSMAAWNLIYCLSLVSLVAYFVLKLRRKI